MDALAVPANGPILIDGKLTESVWSQAPLISEFLQREPAEGLPATQKTEARIAYDDQALYVGVRMYDTDPGKIVGILTRRDQRSPSDWIRIVVDSYFDKRSAYEFAVNPVGVKTDRYYFNDGNNDDSWDAVWDVQVQKNAEGWQAEFRIPFSQLRFNNAEGGPVGFAIIREVGRLAETETWPLLARSANGFVSQFGEVRGLRMGGTPKKFELLPYTVGKVEGQATNEANPLTDGVTPGASVGLDMKYAVTARPHLHRHRQSRLRPGRGRPRRRQPGRLRDVLPRAPAVLRRGIGHVPLQHGLQRRQLHGPLLLAPHWPRSAGLRGRERRRVLDAAGRRHDHRRG